MRLIEAHADELTVLKELEGAGRQAATQRLLLSLRRIAPFEFALSLSATLPHITKARTALRARHG